MANAKLYDNEDIRRIEAIISKLRTTLITKNSDYGSSAFNPPYLLPDLPIEQALLVRLSDKVARLRNLQSNPAKVKNESIEDTLFDMAGYCCLILAAKENSSEK